MSFHNRPAKADMEAVILLENGAESAWQVGVQLNPTVTSGELWEQTNLCVDKIWFLSLQPVCFVSGDLLLLLCGYGGNELPILFFNSDISVEVTWGDSCTEMRVIVTVERTQIAVVQWRIMASVRCEEDVQELQTHQSGLKQGEHELQPLQHRSQV